LSVDAIFGYPDSIGSKAGQRDGEATLKELKSNKKGNCLPVTTAFTKPS